MEELSTTTLAMIFIAFVLLAVVGYFAYVHFTEKKSSALGAAEKSKKPAKAKKTSKPKAVSKSKAKPAPKTADNDKMPADGWTINESPECIEEFKSGTKSVIARLSGDYYRKMKVGDKVRLVTKEGDGVTKVIAEVKGDKKKIVFKDMDEADWKKMCPSHESLDSVINHYSSFYKNKDKLKELEEKRGVIVFVLKD